MAITPNQMVTDRTQRSGYTAVYRVVKIESDRALVQYVGEYNAGRFVNMSHRREETYRDMANLREFK